ncbi:MAG: hypothetical protein AUJ37_02375 [Candidatus Magasanikbacteria bacterium CG1_02_41_34]|uniref:Uncharacterized protein n=1 Tax=Candidatus Magasanikbacteria bacterium CG_4_10_14_0_2_um_filter_41_31 TaxID=1974639 RepID=A0A2M7V4C3_9BACT|nr:MAG: hypothetical protein AUJ37_02375 [Candidatus Magasanikbacteria bacterium CG1_02_41_34]PIZ93298.1 MAG: hypothetical protein COX83_02290 [Candidatus Magasanikbacteria bacterium CG_4_10_14_0_2_um_filter_41_31]
MVKVVDTIERVTLKLPKPVAAYFRKAFPHGQRSRFVEECILSHKHQAEIEKMEKELQKVGKSRQ